jgi:cytochrome b subunit of formate dehydrogenase
MPHGAPELVSYGMLTVFAVGLIFHWSRRALRHPIPTEQLTVEPKGDVLMFDRIQRGFHWATTASFILLIMTGLPLYDPSVFVPIAGALGIPLHGSFNTYVLLHVIASVALASLLLMHIIWDVGKLKATRLMLPTKSDFKDTITRAKSLLLGAKDYPRINKYDGFMKNFHLSTAVAFVALAITGTYMLLYAQWWNIPLEIHFQTEPAWKPAFWHDIFGFLLITLVLGHVYFSILPVNRSIFKAMLSGTIPAEEVAKKYRPQDFVRRSKE